MEGRDYVWRYLIARPREWLIMAGWQVGMGKSLDRTLVIMDLISAPLISLLS
jgi:hypothetical protein